MPLDLSEKTGLGILILIGALVLFAAMSGESGCQASIKIVDYLDSNVPQIKDFDPINDEG